MTDLRSPALADAVAYDLAGLRLLIAARRRELGLRQLDVDDIAGLADGYCGKVEAGIKNFGEMSLPAILGALQCGLQLSTTKLSEMPEAARAYAEKSKILKQKRGRKGGLLAAHRLGKVKCRDRARAGGLMRQSKWRDERRDQCRRNKIAAARAKRDAGDRG